MIGTVRVPTTGDRAHDQAVQAALPAQLAGACEKSTNAFMATGEAPSTAVKLAYCASNAASAFGSLPFGLPT